MRISRILRWTVLMTILAAFAPAPASAQIGRFIKKRLKEKVVQTVVESVVPTDTPATAAPAGTQAAAGAEKAAPGRAVKGGAVPGRALKGAEPSAPQVGPTFNEWVLEMTPAVLEKLEQGLAAEAAEKQANARVLARMRDKPAYDRCSREVMSSPQGKKMLAMLDGGDMQAYQQAAMEVGKVQEARCGPDPSQYNTVKNRLGNKPSEAGEKASGFEYRQYYILKERVLPFCSLAKPAGGGEVKIPVRAEVFLVYSPAEVQALNERCDKLLPALKAIE